MLRQCCFKMSHRKLFLRITWLLLLSSILSGFALLSWNVSKDYFEYRTTWVTSLHDYPEDNVLAPGIVICFGFKFDHRGETKIGELFTGEGNFFNDMNDSWIVKRVEARLTPPSRNVSYVTRKYMRGNKYCMFVKVSDHFSMEEVTSTRWGDLERFYSATTTATPIYSPNVFSWNKTCNPHYAFFQIVKDESYLPNHKNRFAVDELCRDYYSYTVLLTYASYVKVRKPPPYDTNCLDYNNTGIFLSKSDCYDRCLKNATIQWNFVPEITLIDREMYKRSTTFLAPNIIIEDENYLDSLKENANISKDVMEKYRIVSTHWKGIKDSCKKFCSRHECKHEKISPQVYLRHWTKNETYSLAQIKLILLLSYLPTLHVSSIPKQKLIDYTVYMCSMLSFWIGLCPLTLADVLVKRLLDYTKKKVSMSLEERIRVERTIRKERQLEERMQKIERDICVMKRQSSTNVIGD